MYKELKITPPFFEVGPKAIIWGEEMLALAKVIDKTAMKYDVDIIVTPQYTDIKLLADNTERILVFAQHMDALVPGRGLGSVLPEAVKAAGAVGVMLNHAERKLTIEEVSIKTAECLSPFIEKSKNNPSIMIIGLGNRNITPDSLGPKVVDKIVVTRHIKSNAQFSQNIDKRLGMVCAIAPGVMGTTGIETGEIIMGLIEKAGPDIVIVIDALCARKTSRVNTTIQISDTGIVPGSGVGNHRMELSKETLGIPVIAIGVPTVVDCSTIAHDLLLSYNESVSEEDLMKKINHSSISDMVVTPKDIDAGISRMSTAISNGINLAVHKGFDFGDISDYLI